MSKAGSTPHIVRRQILARLSTLKPVRHLSPKQEADLAVRAALKQIERAAKPAQKPKPK